jgi:hypothetical protein
MNIMHNVSSKRRLGGVNWIDLAQYRDRWQALVKAAMNLQVP